jgi:hypothetical protein
MKNEIPFLALSNIINDFLTIKKINDKKKENNHFLIVNTNSFINIQIKDKFINANKCLINSRFYNLYTEKTMAVFDEFNSFLRNYFVGQSIKKNRS